MKQLIQNLKTGKMELLEVPAPAMPNGYLLIRNHYSLISAGTEGSKVKTARSSLIQKARKKPDQVKQVLDSVKTEGLSATYNKVMNKLDFPSPLGYSCAGEVIDVAGDVQGFKVGDRVACGGATATHAELVAVPKNLCIKVPDNVSMEYAAFTTVASIALQGIRQADVKLGENAVVVGLGLIGQLIVQMLSAAGVRVAGIDIDDRMVELARESGACLAFNRNDPRLESELNSFSYGHGVDAVIISAGTSSTDPVELAGRLCRRKGKVIIVGAVPTGFSRPNYYKKELELRMSASYGPGRYDDNYEEKGLDYPIGYVRWTENRNMQAFLQLLAGEKLPVNLLLSHTFSFDNALEAYELIMSKKEPFTGILLEYDREREIAVKTTFGKAESPEGQAPRVGFIGAGSFAQKFLLPNVAGKAALVTVATASGNNATNIAQKYGFAAASGDARDVTGDSRINTVFIATRHNTHARYVLDSLEQGKHVFVEKPLALTEEELETIKTEYEKRNVHLMVGFNRRFAPLIQKMRAVVGDDTRKAITYRVNVGHIPADHWTQDPEVGGGRIIGEVCHFVDLCMYIAGSRPVRLSAFSMEAEPNLLDTVSVNILFANGSVANLSYFANGSKALEKEYLEVYSNGVTAVLRDFKELDIYTGRRKTEKSSQDKGHRREVQLFLESVREGKPTPIPFEEIYLSSLLPFKILESMRTGRTVQIDP